MNIPEENSAKETPDKRWLKIRSTQEILDNRYAKIQALESELAELREQLKQERNKAIDEVIELIPIALDSNMTLSEIIKALEYLKVKANES